MDDEELSRRAAESLRRMLPGGAANPGALASPRIASLLELIHNAERAMESDHDESFSRLVRSPLTKAGNSCDRVAELLNGATGEIRDSIIDAVVAGAELALSAVEVNALFEGIDENLVRGENVSATVKRSAASRRAKNVDRDARIRAEFARLEAKGLSRRSAEAAVGKKFKLARSTISEIVRR